MKDKIIFDAKVSNRKILLVPVNSICHTPYNPSSRTKEGAKLKKLIDSICVNGLVYPILITSDRNVIDGNRRLAAVRTLGHEFIECVVSDLDRDKAFTTVNTTAEKIGGRGWLEIGRGGGHLPPKEMADFKELFGLIGSYGIDLLISQNIGLNILSLCKSARSLGIGKRIDEIIMLVATYRLTNKVNALLRSDQSTEEKVVAITKLLDSAKDAA